MARRKNADRPAEPAAQKTPVRIARRKRRKPSGARPQPPSARALHGGDSFAERYDGPDAPPDEIKVSRAPRPAERPPANPNVFSYTFTIWKSS